MKLNQIYGYVIILILTPFSTNAQVIESLSCSQEDVQAAIDMANDGDTVLLPVETCAWTSAVTIGKQLTWGDNPTYESKEITLMGQGIDATVIESSAEYGGTLLNIIGVEGKPIRVTGITFKNVRRTTTTWPAIKLFATVWRIDHCKFDMSDITPWQQGRGVMVTGNGLIDHCEFMNCYQSITPSGGGEGSWNRDLTPGTTDAVYIENCNIVNTEPFDGAIDAYNGARYVFRYNNVVNEGVGHHGMDTGGYRSTLWFEYYHNNYTCTIDRIWALANFRGGTGVFYNNSCAGNYACGIRLVHYCAIPDNNSCVWETCTSYPCTDQIGRGPDSDNDGAQDLVPLYEWNNIKNDESLDILVENYSSAFIVENRDYYHNTYNPGYLPLPYPHPKTLSDTPDKELSLNLTSELTSETFNFSWNEISGAKEYIVLHNWQYVDTITGTSWTGTVLEGMHVYMVYAVNENDNILSAEGKLIGEETLESEETDELNIFPNPFNSQTEITFSVTKQDVYKIEIFNLYGQFVKLVESNEYQVGMHTLSWDGTNNSGNKVKSGMYLIKISSANYCKTAKVMLLNK